jgi:acetolactate synthase-1/2/3 large subunit
MKVTDYIVEFLINHEISHIFGYPGGMVTHFMDSLTKYEGRIMNHINYHEQGAAFAACGYAQVSLKPGVAYATSGPGATNLITGVCNAYFDSIPAIFITGQVNTYESKEGFAVRQRGFQEMDVVSLVENVTKYSTRIVDSNDIKGALERAYHHAVEGRPGPVLLDIPMDVQRADIDAETLVGFTAKRKNDRIQIDAAVRRINEALRLSERPCVLVGSGIDGSGMRGFLSEWIGQIKTPVVSSMLAVDALPCTPYYYGFIGAYGARHSNFIIAKSDCIIALGSRMDLRQVGADADKFAIGARLIRVDIDPDETSRSIKDDEEDIFVDLKDLMPALAESETNAIPFRNQWLQICDEIKAQLSGIDDKDPNIIIKNLSEYVSEDSVITTDVGQNQVWVAQSFVPKGQRVLFSGGHGAMGYSLPASIGAHYASGKRVIAFCGDGGIQMNIQELQFIARENLPITIVLMNNRSLGMIRHFQEMYFDGVYSGTKAEMGYTTPDFEKVAGAYGIPYLLVSGLSNISHIRSCFRGEGPKFIEISLSETTYVYPKLAVEHLNQDQEPELERSFFDYLSSL